MTSPFRHACLALVFAATAVPANAQTWVYEPDARPRYYEPDPGARYYYEPRARYWEPYYGVDARARVYEPDARVVVGSGAALALTPTQRTTIYRTIIPQGRGKGPIVRERIVTETIAPAPVVRERVVTRAHHGRLHGRLAGDRRLCAGADAGARWCGPFRRCAPIATWWSTTACCWSIRRPGSWWPT